METTVHQRIALTDVILDDRIRVDLGDVEDFALSLRDQPLLHPIVIDDKSRLIAGGRRHAAYSLLASGAIPDCNPADFATIPFKCLGDLPLSQQKQLELEENLRRKEMTWTEYAIGIADYHKLRQLDQVRKGGDLWTQSMTGKLIGVTQAHVSPILSIAAELKADPTSPYWECENLTGAIQIKLGKKIEEANADVLRRINDRRAEMDSTNPDSAAQNQSVSDILASITADDRPMEPTLGTPKEKVTIDQAAQMVQIGDSLQLLSKMGRVDHIITDPPYGEDMKNLDTFKNIETVEKEHKVPENVKLLKDFLDISFNVISEAGFLCMWYDLDQHEMLSSHARKVGWKVCRWPFHWCKTSPCRNSAAQYNITKAVEHCMILRRSEKSIIANKVSKNYVLASSDEESRDADHPFYKPFAVWKPLIEAVSFENQVIVDPFAGECSSLIANILLKRVPFGIELVEDHAIKGIRRIHKALNAPPIEELMMVAPI